MNQIQSNNDPQQLFQLMESIGQGAYGNVWKALNKMNGQIVAIKIVQSQSDIPTLQQQINILKQCKSQYIVKYYSSYYKNNSLWLVMQFCQAGSVIDLIRITEKWLNQIQIASILKSTLQGLNYLHKNKIIHRDVKAGNILLDDKGHAKLADFGVSAQLKYTNAKKISVVGSPYWMSPQILFMHKYDYKTDIWSLGITAIQLAQGVPPYSHMHPYRAMFFMKTNPPKGLSQPTNWQCIFTRSTQFNNFISKCLIPQIEKRPTCQQLLKHEFIVKKAKGKNILVQLVQNSIDKIQAYRVSFTHKGQNNKKSYFVQASPNKQQFINNKNTIKQQLSIVDQIPEEQGTFIFHAIQVNQGVQQKPEFMKYFENLSQIPSIQNIQQQVQTIISNTKKQIKKVKINAKQKINIWAQILNCAFGKQVKENNLKIWMNQINKLGKQDDQNKKQQQTHIKKKKIKSIQIQKNNEQKPTLQKKKNKNSTHQKKIKENLQKYKDFLYDSVLERHIKKKYEL